jgi:hypothetical protein
VKVRALLVSLLSLAAMATVAGAQPRRPVVPKAVRACGVSAIPLSVGNSWTYEPTPPPPDRALSEAQMKNTPWPPKKLVITVDAVDTVDGVTTVSMSEDLDGKIHKTSLTCKAGGGNFQIGPTSFWYAGEPGPVYGIELSDVVRKGHTFELAGGKLTGLEWHDDLEAKWKHVPTSKLQPTMRTGTLNQNRHFVVQPPEAITTKAGSWKAANKLGIEVLTKVTIEPAPPLPLKELPLLVNFLWVADGVGVVQALNSFGQQYVLTAYTVQ